MPPVITATKPKRLTYDAYLTEGEITQRYDIIDGERISMPGVKWWHQRISKRLTVIFDRYEGANGVGKSVAAPFDLLIHRDPLQTRQPDLFFISNVALQSARNYEEAGYLEVAPELVVEIISDSETEKRFGAKINDYRAIGVKECWKVLRDTRTVEVLRLTSVGTEIARIYGIGETIQSVVFPALAVSIDEIFAE